MTIERPMFPPVDPTRRHLLTIAAGGAVAAAIPTATLTAAPAVDPIYAATERHKEAASVWYAAVHVRSDFLEGPEPMTDEQWEQLNTLDEALDAARDVLNKTAVDFVGTTPTTVAGIVNAIAYIQRQMRDDGTFMPSDLEFHYDVGYEGGDGAVVFGWLDAFLNTIAVAVSEFDPAPAVQL
jgi:hypothetical protein